MYLTYFYPDIIQNFKLLNDLIKTVKNVRGLNNLGHVKVPENNHRFSTEIDSKNE